MKPTLTRLFEKQNNGITYVGFVRAMRFYPVDSAAAGSEALVNQEGYQGTPTESGWYMVALNDGAIVHCRWSFPVYP